MAGRRANGEGTIYRRKDGRYEAAGYFLTASGIRKRVRVYGDTRQAAREKLNEKIAQSQQGVPVPDKTWKLSGYLDYWLENFVRVNRRAKTYEQYECAVRLYLKPGLGAYSLSRLSVPIVQSFLNQKLDEGCSVRKVQIVRTTLSAALTRAMREELVGRNVARLVELPEWQQSEVFPWSAEEAKQFLDTAAQYRLYAAFALLLFYGLRRGEVLGLRWQDIDQVGNELHIRQQLQRIGRSLRLGPVKTRAGQRNLPLTALVWQVLTAHREQQDRARKIAGASWVGSRSSDELVFTTKYGGPIEPRNFVRSFWGICKASGVRIIKLHHLRHTQATFLEALGTPARQAQLILGHSHISTTQQIYTHPDQAGRRDAIERVEALFRRTVGMGGMEVRGGGVREGGGRCRQGLPSTWMFGDGFTSVIGGGPSGARTHDTLLKSSIDTPLPTRLASINEVVNASRRRWLIGAVAVNAAVRTQTEHHTRSPDKNSS
jgi:integrase